MKIILLILLSAFISANLIILQQKVILPHIGNHEYFCIKNTLFFICVIIYMTLINKNIYNNIKNKDLSNYKLILVFDTLLTIANIMIWYYLLQNKDAYKLVSTVNPLTIALIVIISYTFYDAKITRNEIIGILFVLMGIVIINKK